MQTTSYVYGLEEKASSAYHKSIMSNERVRPSSPPLRHIDGGQARQKNGGQERGRAEWKYFLWECPGEPLRDHGKGKDGELKNYNLSIESQRRT